jgi:hypothetical protein
LDSNSEGISRRVQNGRGRRGGAACCSLCGGFGASCNALYGSLRLFAQYDCRLGRLFAGILAGHSLRLISPRPNRDGMFRLGLYLGHRADLLARFDGFQRLLAWEDEAARYFSRYRHASVPDFKGAHLMASFLGVLRQQVKRLPVLLNPSIDDSAAQLLARRLLC